MDISFNLESSNVISDSKSSAVTQRPIQKSLTRSMWIAFWTNFLFAIIEFAGGILTNSVTVLSDAMHDFGDSMVIGLSLFFEKKSTRGRTDKYTYGQRRFSILAAFLTSLILIIGSVFIAITAIQRFIHIETVATNGVIWLAVLGIVCNGFAAIRLMKDSKQSLNHKGIMLHLLEDVLGWIAVLIGATVMHYTHWYWIDPLLSLVIATVILWNACKNLFSSFEIFLQAKPDDFDNKKISEEVKNINGVAEISNLHCWTLDGMQHVLTMQILTHSFIDKNATKQIRLEIDKILRNHKIEHATIEIN